MKYSDIKPSILFESTSATILSFKSLSIPNICSLDNSAGKKSAILSKLPDSILFLKSVALTPEPGLDPNAKPFTLSVLLVSKINLFSLKIKNYDINKSRINFFRIILIVSSLILFYFFNFVSIPVIILIYITLSLTHNLLK